MSNEAHEKALDAAIEASGMGGWDHIEERMEDAIKAYLSASGLVVVPREPTPEMIAEAWASWKIRHPKPIGPGPGFVEAITASIAAAPNPFESKQDE